MARIFWALSAAFIALIALTSAMVFVDETEFVIITQFGEHKRTLDTPGLAFKVPFVQEGIHVEKRILARDTLAQEILTADKKRLLADPVTRWRVADPLQYYKSVRSEDGAKRNIDAVVQSELRQELAHHAMSEMVGSARSIMMVRVTERTRERLRPLGIEVVDVQIKRLDLPSEVQKSVFDRMKAERERLAKGYRAQGQEKADAITADADKQSRIILAEAEQRAQEVKGLGDAEAAKTYADAYGRDTELYSFVRSLETYEKSLGAESTIVLSTGSKLFRYLTRTGDGDKDTTKGN